MSGTNPSSFEWPMLLQFAGEAELGIVRTRDEWEIDPDLYARRYQADDRLIDSAGVEYRLEFRSSSARGRNEIVPTGRRYDPGEVASLAARHIENVGARPEWLSSHLRDIVESQRIRAIILYLAKLAAADVSEAAEDEE